MQRRERGRLGEETAEKVLRRAGLVILARNWRAAGGELDRVALDGETVVFVEVKSRADAVDAQYAGRAPVSTRQRWRIERCARAFKRRYGVTQHAHRFDVITVQGDTPAQGDVRWMRSAFGPPTTGTQARSDR